MPGHHAGGSLLVYLYFVVGLLGAAMTPYEVYFYSSGAVEDGWGLKELGLNKVTSMIGYGARRLSLLRADDRRGRALPSAGDLDPQFLGTPALAAEHALGQVGLLLALVGILFAVGGAAIETSLLGRLQHGPVLRLALGQEGAARPRASRFTLSWLVIFALALLVVMTGYDPVKLTEYSVIFSVVALPLTYLPILLVANDRTYMGSNVNGRLANVLGVLYFVVILVDRRRGHPAVARDQRRPGMSKVAQVDIALGDPRPPARRPTVELRQGRRSRDHRPDGGSPEVVGDPRRRRCLAIPRSSRDGSPLASRGRGPRALVGGRLRHLGRDPQADGGGARLESRRPRWAGSSGRCRAPDATVGAAGARGRTESGERLG